jgi:Xaa-Pro aminopeptidase
MEKVLCCSKRAFIFMKLIFVMKNILIASFIICFLSGCNKPWESGKTPTSLKGISDADKLKILSERRKSLLKKIEKGIIIIRSDYGFNGGRNEFRAASNFYYLTGFAQPGSLMILDRESPGPYSLFVSEKTINEAIYSGVTPGKAEITDAFQADTVLALEQSDRVIEESIRNGRPVYMDNSDVRFKVFVQEIIQKIKGDKSLLRNIAPDLHEMRVIKDSVEIAEIRKAVGITGKAFLNACRVCKPGMFEYEVEAMIEYTFRKNGSPIPAFQSIVGSGPNAVKLHYSENNRQMQQGDLLLMDIGTEMDYLCSDITRTIPVSGKFSKEQRNIYELVLKSQKAAMAAMKPGNYLIAGHNGSAAILVRGLYELGLITDTTKAWQKKFYLLYPISHYLGMDVHDVGDYGTTFPEMVEKIASGENYGRKLETGMVVTVEPGLYFRNNGLCQLSELFGKEASGDEIRDFIDKVTPVYEKYKNIGIRIEDDVLITEEGCENLSKNIPKEIADIERILKKSNRLKLPF